MTVKKTVSVTGYCPYLGSEHSIDATYGKINFVGDMTSYARLLSYYCDCSSECTEQSCPLEKLADSRQFW